MSALVLARAHAVRGHWGDRFDVVRFAAAPEAFLRARLARDGDPFFIRFPPLGDVIVTGHPNGARDVFTASPDAFVPAGPNPVEPLLGAASLILLDGDRHRRERKLFTPPFHGERLRAYGEIIAKLTVDAIVRLTAGERVSAQALARGILLEVIARAVFGIRDEARRGELARAIVAMLDGYTTSLVAFPWLRRPFGGLGPWARFTRARAAFRALVAREIAERRARGRLDGVDDGDDVLSMLLAARYDDGSALTEAELLDELATLLVAGHETSATGLVWALHYVHTVDGLRDALMDEIRAGARAPGHEPEALAKLPLLGATCQEALRLHPVVPIALRRAAQDVTVRGVPVPRGACLAVALTLLHHDAQAFPEPSRFHPARFLERKPSPFEYAPFGGGARRCIGAAFAMHEMKIVLGTLLARARFRAPNGKAPRPIIQNITMAPRSEIWLDVEAVTRG